jgi:hypothetical protein
MKPQPKKETRTFPSACFSLSPGQLLPVPASLRESVQKKNPARSRYFPPITTIVLRRQLESSKPHSQFVLRINALGWQLAGKSYQNSKRGKKVRAGLCIDMQFDAADPGPFCSQCLALMIWYRPNEFCLQAADILLHCDTLATQPDQNVIYSCRACLPQRERENHHQFS